MLHQHDLLAFLVEVGQRAPKEANVLPILSLCSQPGDDRFEQTCLNLPPLSDLRFEVVTEGHESIDFGDDAVLLRERGEGNR